MKKFIIILFVLVIVAGLLWLFLFKNDGVNIIETNKVIPESSDSTSEQIATTTSTIAEVAQNNELYVAAIAELDSDMCEGIDKIDTKYRCFTRVAVELGQTDVCQAITETTKRQDCLDQLTYQNAINLNDLTLCSTILDSFWKNSCLNVILEAQDYNFAICDELDKDKITCQNIVIFEKTKITGQCDELTDPTYKLECEQAQIEYVPAPIAEEEEEEEDIADVDSDNDGLLDSDEINIYNTDPNKADTDSDGYSDGQEVESGYDPLN